ncbi:hypothetical protein IP88_06295 [alpha proteobacterium AAP81b]|nr:hypothetical protein IP88_06295 [alpha proteobacterium AAP81b]
MPVSRRQLLAAPLLLAGTNPAPNDDLAATIATIEARSGRFGVAARDLASGWRFAHRGDERFALASTFKLLLAGAILTAVDAGRLRLAQTLHVTASDLVSYAPVTETLVGRRASLATLCDAAVTLSDNAAANLLLPLVGGPAGLTRWLRRLGDPVTRLDRFEPALNLVPPGEVRDTTTPDAMLASVIRLRDRLSAASRARLDAWLIASRTGGRRLRAGLPATWIVGDKTGTASGIANDVAIAWRPGVARPLLIAAYRADGGDGAMADADHTTLARALVASAMNAV